MHPVDFNCLQMGIQNKSDYIMLYPPSPPRYPFTMSMMPTKKPTKNENLETWKSSWSVIILWTSLSTLVTLTCTVGFAQSEWFVREQSISNSSINSEWLLSYDRGCLLNTLGMFKVCFRENNSFSCHKFGSGLSPFPSLIWQGVCIFYGSGCVLQTCGVMILVFSLYCGGGTQRRVAAHLVSHIHVVAGLLQTVSLLLYPIVLNTQTGRLHCGFGAQAYVPDQCRVGWAYVAATSGTLLTFYCPFLAYFSFYRTYSREEYWTI